MSRLESIKEEITESLIDAEHGIVMKRVDELISLVQRYETVLKEANTIIHDYKESRGYREQQVFEIADIIKQALKE